MAIRMISKKPHVYAGKRYQAGDSYDVKGESDRRVLAAVGHADVAPVESPQPKIEPEPTVQMPPRRRTYRTRAMVADQISGEAPANAGEQGA